VATAKVKASQYNHVTETYEKKELKERWNRLLIENEPVRVQRDLYSAYLIMNVQSNLEKIDREACIHGFESFRRMHDQEIIRLQSSLIKRCSSMGM
jgi:hypothetical protein